MANKPESSSLPSLRDKPAPAKTVNQSRKRVSGSDATVLETDLVGMREKLYRIHERSLSVDELLIQLDLKEKSLLARIVELGKKEEQFGKVEEREREVGLRENSIIVKEKEIEMKLKEKEEVMKEIEEKEKEIALKQLEWIEKEKLLRSREKTVTEKETEMKKKENIFKELESKSRTLELKQQELEAKEKILEAKDQQIEWKRMYYELKFDGRSTQVQGETSKRSRVIYLAEKSCEAAASFVGPAKRHKPVTIQEDEVSVCVAEALKREAEEAGVVSQDDTVEELVPEPEPIALPDSEFHDFNKTMDSFAIGDVWALYDPLDNMPRLYCRIQRVNKHEPSLLVTWLEYRNDEGASVVGPVSCGRFRYGTKESQGYLKFSHKMVRTIRGQYLIKMCPQVGETWALFRDWTNNPGQPPYRYDFVEVVREFDDNQGIRVAYLGKVEGFVSVFHRAKQHGVLSLLIRPEEMKRFSHRVPSFKLNGEEKEGVPAGSFELDPAALPSSVFEHDQDGSRQDDQIISID